MCRNIHTLYNFEPAATDDEVRAAALQYVRKISGFTKPSRANEEAFERAVDDVAAASRRLIDSLVTSAPAKDRELEAERARAALSFGVRGGYTLRGNARGQSPRASVWGGDRCGSLAPARTSVPPAVASAEIVAQSATRRI
jgi:hypothetical protein